MLKIVRGDNMKKCIVSVFMMIILCGCTQKQVELTNVVPQVANTTTVCYGTVVSDDCYTLTIQKGAVIENIFFEQGERVSEGDLVAQSYYNGTSQNHIAESGGVITELQLSIGDKYDGKKNIIITKTDNVYLTVLLEQRDISIVKVGDSAKVSGEAFQSSEYDATVEKIYSVAEQSGDTVYVTAKLRLDNADDSVVPGLSAVAEITTVSDTKRFILPDSSIGYDGRYYVCNEALEKIYLTYAKKCDEGYIVEGVETTQAVLLNVSEADK